MSRLPIRLRLTLVFALVMALVLAGAGWFLYARVAGDLDHALDQQLRARAQDVSALVLRGGTLRGTTGSLVEHGETFAELVGGHGRVLDATAPIGRKPLLTPTQLERARGGPVFVNRGSVPGLDEHVRMLAVPLERRGARLVLVVGTTRENRSETLHSLRKAFLVGGPIALLLASIGGFLLAGAALRPIEAMRRRAAEISTTSLHDRLPVPQAADEVSRLGRTLNAMLARIEEGLERERRFVADASHELRTPIALLRTELELALSRERSAEDLEAAIRSAWAETERLERIADDLLLLARSEQGQIDLQLEPIDVADLLQEVAARFAPRAAGEGRALTVDAGEPMVVEADRIRLDQALGNLVDNALRHGRGGISIGSAISGGSVELHVADEGPGFPAAFLPQAFERFSRADGARRETGTGLGLAIVETIARSHGGKAGAANRPGGGADVWISLPSERPRDRARQAAGTSETIR